MNNNITYCGFIGIIGKSNVGKSSLFNKLMKRKISIISSKPHTTRNAIMGIKTEGIYQSIYIDTPGISLKEKRPINMEMNKIIYYMINNVKLLIFLTDRTTWSNEDKIIVKRLHLIKCPIILAINKIDLIKKKTILLPHMKFLHKEVNANDIVPISVKKNINLEKIAYLINNYLPTSKHFFSRENVTNCSLKFLISEIIREKLIMFLGEELPYSVLVNIEQLLIKNNCYHIKGLIFVERYSQKKIVIGSQGKKIRIIRIRSKADIEKIFQKKVFLELWVKVKFDWYHDHLNYSPEIEI